MGQSTPEVSKGTAPPVDVGRHANNGAAKFDSPADIQAELFSKLTHANLRWMGTIKKRAHLASEFTAELAAARSFAETVAACQEWVRQRMEIAEEDAKQLCSDSEALMNTAVRLFLGSNGGNKP